MSIIIQYTIYKVLIYMLSYSYMIYKYINTGKLYLLYLIQLIVFVISFIIVPVRLCPIAAVVVISIIYFFYYFRRVNLKKKSCYAFYRGVKYCVIALDV